MNGHRETIASLEVELQKLLAEANAQRSPAVVTES